MDALPYESEAALVHLMAAEREVEKAHRQARSAPTIDGLEANAIEVSVGKIRDQLDAILRVLDGRQV
jgi:hypothetical protein